MSKPKWFERPEHQKQYCHACGEEGSMMAVRIRTNGERWFYHEDCKPVGREPTFWFTRCHKKYNCPVKICTVCYFCEDYRSLEGCPDIKKKF